MNKIWVRFLSFAVAIFLFNNLTCEADVVLRQAPYEALLSENELTIYHLVYQKALAYDTSIFETTASISEEELSKTMNCFFNDHPEVYWLETGYRYATNSQGYVTKIQLKYGISVDFINNSKLLYEQQLQRIVEGAQNYSNPLDKERYIHDMICAMNVYDLDAQVSQGAYSALVNGTSMCAGYSRAFQVACQSCDIPCYYITGTSKGQDHAWNVVYINGQFYNVDITWDDCLLDQLGTQTYAYFNKTTAEFSLDHTPSELSSLIGYF